eukprot:795010-Pelagomonas_calceolata.AAC.1
MEPPQWHPFPDLPIGISAPRISLGKGFDLPEGYFHGDATVISSSQKRARAEQLLGDRGRLRQFKVDRPTETPPNLLFANCYCWMPGGCAAEYARSNKYAGLGTPAYKVYK